MSQSGRPPDVLSALAAAREQACPTLAVTNEAMSLLAVALGDRTGWGAAERELRQAPPAMAATLAGDPAAAQDAVEVLAGVDIDRSGGLTKVTRTT